VTDWSAYIACGICPALAGEACFVRSAGGPEALPEIRSEVPHSGRPRSAKAGGAVRKPRPQAARSGTANPVRRSARRTANTVASWQQLAEQRRRG
jgi:hypothetical protein